MQDEAKLKIVQIFAFIILALALYAAIWEGWKKQDAIEDARTKLQIKEELQ